MERNLALEKNIAGSALQPLPRCYWNWLVAWAVVTLLFTVLPGIAALANCYGMRRCQTAEERQQKADAAFNWCLVGTLLVAIVLRLASIR